MTKVDIPLKTKADGGSDAFIQNEKDVEVRVRAPKRVLHFSDGTLEEYSDDDETDQVDHTDQAPAVDESSLKWTDWMRYKTYKIGSTVLAGCDYVGEGLASFLGITTPKYSYEIEEFKRLQAEQQAEERAIQTFVEQNRPQNGEGTHHVTSTQPPPTAKKSTTEPPNPETAVRTEVSTENEIQKF
ncbi:protein FAM177A1 [Anopheles aquasalis]|uniref:protein FAM177A1 n=1 Tax=Anopheles aquasalis TaxID=42839 RepID=UPI00215AD17F|nr:protein FAM177A1 [Anopheles aquasalis]